MADTTFTDQSTVVTADWLNALNLIAYHLLGAGGTPPTTAADILTNLGVSGGAYLESANNLSDVASASTALGNLGGLAIASNLSDLASAASARTNLGLGSLATLSSINNANWSGTDLAVANGGTGASDAATARSNLGITDGVGVGQSYSNPANSLGTTYQNTSGQPIFVWVFSGHSAVGNSVLTAYVDSVSSPTQTAAKIVVDNGAAATPALGFVVPNNYYYKVSFADSDAGSNLVWHVLG